MKLVILFAIVVAIGALVYFGRWFWIGFKYGWTYDDGLPEDDYEL